MKLTKQDIALLLKWGHPESDIPQLKAACREVRLSLINGDEEHYIGTREAIDILGRETFLSGISRSAFHASCCRDAPDGRTVYFDLYKWWR